MRACVVAAAGSDLHVLHSALGRAGVRDVSVIVTAVGDPMLFAPPPQFVIGVLAPGERHDGAAGLGSLDVMLRVGRAVERGIPALVIAPPPAAAPAPAAGIWVAPCAVDDAPALDDHLWAFLQNIRSGTFDGQAPPEQSSVDMEEIKDRLIDLTQAHGRFSELTFVELIASALRRTGAPVVETESRSDVDWGRVDIAFVAPGAAGNVVVVECKVGDLRDKDLVLAEQQLQRYVIARQAQLGLLVYHDIAGKDIPWPRSTALTARISATALLDGLAAHSLSDVLAAVSAEAVSRF